jgi:hypothetical protein
MKLAIIASTAAIAVYAGATATTSRSEPLHPNAVPAARHVHSTLRADMRKAWAEHTIYTHQYLVSAIEGIPDATVIVTRLMKNQEQIGDVVGEFYGKAAGDKMTMLLKQHISQAADLVKALKVGDKAGGDLLGKQWRENADAIADLLSKANPNWKKADLLGMLNAHLDHVAAQAKARLDKQWDADVTAQDKNFDHMMKMSDALADGIAKQFPSKVTADIKLQ